MYYLKFNNQEDVDAFCSIMGKEQVVFWGTEKRVHFYSVDKNEFFVLPIEEVENFSNQNEEILQENLSGMIASWIWPDGFLVQIKNKKGYDNVMKHIRLRNPFAAVFGEPLTAKPKKIDLSVVNRGSLAEWVNKEAKEKKRYSYAEFLMNVEDLIPAYCLLKFRRHVYDSADSKLPEILAVINAWAAKQGLKITLSKEFDKSKWYGVYLLMGPGEMKVIFEPKIHNEYDEYSTNVDVDQFLENPSQYLSINWRTRM